MFSAQLALFLGNVDYLLLQLFFLKTVSKTSHATLNLVQLHEAKFRMIKRICNLG